MENSWNRDVPVQSSMHETTLPPPELKASGTTCKGSLDMPLLLGQVLHEIYCEAFSIKIFIDIITHYLNVFQQHFSVWITSVTCCLFSLPFRTWGMEMNAVTFLVPEGILKKNKCIFTGILKTTKHILPCIYVYRDDKSQSNLFCLEEPCQGYSGPSKGVPQFMTSLSPHRHCLFCTNNLYPLSRCFLVLFNATASSNSFILTIFEHIFFRQLKPQQRNQKHNSEWTEIDLLICVAEVQCAVALHVLLPRLNLPFGEKNPKLLFTLSNKIQEPHSIGWHDLSADAAPPLGLSQSKQDLGMQAICDNTELNLSGKKDFFCLFSFLSCLKKYWKVWPTFAQT